MSVEPADPERAPAHFLLGSSAPKTANPGVSARLCIGIIHINQRHKPEVFPRLKFGRNLGISGACEGSTASKQPQRQLVRGVSACLWHQPQLWMSQAPLKAIHFLSSPNEALILWLVSQHRPRKLRPKVWNNPQNMWVNMLLSTYLCSAWDLQLVLLLLKQPSWHPHTFFLVFFHSFPLSKTVFLDVLDF